MQHSLPRAERGSYISALRGGVLLAVTARSLVLATTLLAFVTGCGGNDASNATPPVTDPPAPAIVISPPGLEFDAHAGGIDPLGQLVSITAGADPSIGAVAVADVTYGVGQPTNWIRSQVAGSILPSQLVVRAVTGSLPVGVYTATIALVESGTTKRLQTVLVTFTVTP